MEKILESFILTFNNTHDSNFIDENDFGHKLANYGKDIYINYKNEFDTKLDSTTNLIDITSDIDDLISTNPNQTNVMFGLIYLSLIFTKDIGSKELKVDVILQCFTNYIYPYVETNKDYMLQFYKLRKSIKSSREKLLRLLD
jgi:hypothetical protein